MTISSEVARAASAVYQNSIQEMSEEVLIAAECIHRLIIEMKDKGKQHAQEGLRPASSAPIDKLLASMESEDFRKECSMLLHDAYIAGYNSVRIR